MIYDSGEDWRAAPHKRVMLFGMSGLGKTHLSALLRAKHILDNWPAYAHRFVKVMPVDYRRALEQMQARYKTTERKGVSVAVGY